MLRNLILPVFLIAGLFSPHLTLTLPTDLLPAHDQINSTTETYETTEYEPPVYGTRESTPDDLTTQYGPSEFNPAGELKEIYGLLDEGGRQTVVSTDDNKKIVLLVGLTGSGKSTFAQFIAGDNSLLESQADILGSGDFVIVDNSEKDRIGFSGLAKTTFPELVVEPKTETSFYDLPGFSDRRYISYDIAAAYHTKRVIDSATAVKIVFVVNHRALKSGVDPTEFKHLVRHAQKLIPDIGKFKDGVALVVSKVDNRYDQGKLVEDQKVVQTIADYLKTTRAGIQSDLNDPKSDKKEGQVNRSAIKLLDIFLTKTNGEFSRIGLFRRPDMEGQLTEVPLLQNGKARLEQILYKNIKFIPKNPADFGHALTDRTKCIFPTPEETNREILQIMTDLSEGVKDEGTRQNYFSAIPNFDRLLTKQSDYQTLNEMGQELRTKMNLLDFGTTMENSTYRYITDHGYSGVIARRGDYWKFFEAVSGQPILRTPIEWAEPLLKVLPAINESVWETAGYLNNNLVESSNETAEELEKIFREPFNVKRSSTAGELKARNDLARMRVKILGDLVTDLERASSVRGFLGTLDEKLEILKVPEEYRKKAAMVLEEVGNPGDIKISEWMGSFQPKEWIQPWSKLLGSMKKLLGDN